MKSLSRVLLVLVCAQFIIVLDTTFMNVSISKLVVDLHTTVTGVQAAITMYALTMAALMIPGAKFGDIVGRKRAFMTGLLIYGLGTTITSLSGSLMVFIIGWSLLEGIGAALMLPAMMSLIAYNFPPGAARTRAYSAFAATAGAAAAIGPIIGGLFTTYLSWRLAFVSELLVVLFILSQRQLIKEQALKGEKPKFDWLGFGLSSLGLVTIVEGIILASSYGIVKARRDFNFAGLTLSAGGISPTIILVIIGAVILGIFVAIESRRLKRKKSTLLDVTLLKKRIITAGSITQMTQALVLTAVIFALSLYVQMELNYSAIKSGLTLLPLSIGVLVMSAIAGRRLSSRFSPKTVMLAGFVLIIFGDFILGLIARNATSGSDFLIGLFVMGVGVGSVVSQNQNMMISDVPAEKTNETSGFVNTFQNVGSSLGTSIAGAVILAVFISVATTTVNSSSAFSASQKDTLNQAIVSKAQIVSNQQLTSATSHLPPSLQAEIIQINAKARQRALTVVYYAIGIVGLIGVGAIVILPKSAPLAGPTETAKTKKPFRHKMPSSKPLEV